MPAHRTQVSQQLSEAAAAAWSGRQAAGSSGEIAALLSSLSQASTHALSLPLSFHSAEECMQSAKHKVEELGTRVSLQGRDVCAHVSLCHNGPLMHFLSLLLFVASFCFRPSMECKRLARAPSTRQCKLRSISQSIRPAAASSPHLFRAVDFASTLPRFLFCTPILPP